MGGVPFAMKNLAILFAAIASAMFLPSCNLMPPASTGLPFAGGDSFLAGFSWFG
jgi:hypothetical protein